jgi:predicted nucleic acid-binding Zn ribbon protein
MAQTLKSAGYRPPAKLGSLLDRLLGELGLTHKLGGWRIAADWPEIVGEKIAGASQAIRFEDDTLLVSVPDSVWRQQLSLEVEAILEKIHAVPGGKAVKKIHFVS